MKPCMVGSVDETLLVRIEDHRIKQLRGKEIPLVKVIWRGASGEDATWELESQMRVDYPTLFDDGKFRGRNFFLGGWSCNTQFFLK